MYIYEWAWLKDTPRLQTEYRIRTVVPVSIAWSDGIRRRWFACIVWLRRECSVLVITASWLFCLKRQTGEKQRPLHRSVVVESMLVRSNIICFLSCTSTWKNKQNTHFHRVEYYTVSISGVPRGVVWEVQTPPRNSEDIVGVLDRMSKKNRRLDFLL